MAAPIEYTLSDGVTKLPLRVLTLHPDDAEAMALNDEYLGLNEVVDGRLAESKKSKDANEIIVNNAITAAALKKRTEVFKAFCEKYFVKDGGTLEDIRKKIIPQLTRDDMETISRVAAQGANYERRILQSLWSLNPIPTLENALDLLCNDEAARPYLIELVASLSKRVSPLSGTAEPPSTSTSPTA